MDNNIAERIKIKRLEMGLSQGELGQKASIAPAQISRYESGITSPSNLVASRLAKALNVDLEWLVGGTSSPPPQSNDGATNLSGADLTSANLSNANLTGVNLESANLTNANLSGANLTNALLIGANLTRANLDGAILKGADFRWLVAGNGKNILTLQTGHWSVIYTSEELALDKWQFKISEWFDHNHDAKNEMPMKYRQWWLSSEPLIKDWIQAFPAEPTEKQLKNT